MNNNILRIKSFALASLSFVILFLSCNRSTVNLEYTNAKNEVPTLGNLIFRFSKALVNDSMVNRWDSTGYINFEPKIEGRFRWEHPNELVFSPSRPLSPATSYKATLQKDLLAFSSYGKIKTDADINFYTPSLKLDQILSNWVITDENSNTAAPQLELYFNYAVNPNTLKDKLQLTIEGQPVAYSIQTLSPDNRVTLRLEHIKMEDKDFSVQVSVDKGLIPEGGTNGTEQPNTTKADVPSPYRLTITDVNAQQDGSGGTVKVTTSQQVNSNDLANFIKLDPTVKFTVETQDDGFLIRSDHFDFDKTYRLDIASGLKGKIGGVLKESYSNSIAFGELEPSIGFANSKAIYLSSKGDKNIEVKIVNVPKIKIVVSKIYENNLLAAQRNGYIPHETGKTAEGDDDGMGAYSESYSGSNDNADYDPGDVIYEKEIDSRSLPQYGNSRIFKLDIADKLPEFKGIYHVMIRSTKDYWVKDSRFVSLSDIGLVAKEGKDKVLVFANSIRTAASLPNINVIAYGVNNQVLGMAATNADGVAELTYSRKEFANFKPAMIIAKSADDFNYLPFSNTKVNTSRFETGGKIINPTGLDAFVYAERDIYRPGETVNFSVIVRDKQWKSPGDLPLKLKFLYPNGKELKSFRKGLNDQGSLEGSVDIATAAITGSYSLEVYSSNDVLLASQPFRIEEFVPDRIKVSAKLDKEFLQPGSLSTLSIHAVNFFGPPAADRNYECEIQVKQKNFNPAKFGHYNFSLANQTSFFDKVEREGKTNAEGDAAESYTVPELYKNIGILQANFYTTVFDETGRPVSKTTSTPIYTQPVFLGISDNDNSFYNLNQQIVFPLIALDKNEKVLDGVQAKVVVIKHEYRTVLSKIGSYFRYESQQDDKLLASADIAVNGDRTTYSFTPHTPGSYELRVSIPGANSYVSRSFYSYGSWGGNNNSFEVNNEGNIDIETDKSSYAVGDKMKLLFKAPFDGRMLVTVETDKVISYQYLNVEKRNASLDLDISAESLPNAYITATLFKPHELSEIPLTVAHGFQNIKVEEKSRKIDIRFDAKKTVRSHTVQTIKVKAIPNSMVTLAAVDNGILQVSDFATPDPYSYFYGKRALDVDAYDLYTLLFPEIRARMSSTGGDMDKEMKKRSNSMPAKRFKLVSYWSGIKQADANGNAEFEVSIPQFSGELRLMAVAYKDHSFGSAEDKMTVADPIVLSTALPRFLSPKDTVTVPVTITNTTARQADATAVLKLSGSLAAAGNSRQTISVQPNSEAHVQFRIVAAPAIGTGKVNVEVTGLGETFKDETEISIRPSAGLQKKSGSGSIAAESATAVDLNLNDFIPGSIDKQLVVSRSPAVEMSKYLNYLVEYPYGCTEQTISIAFPQLYYGDLADLMRPSAQGKASANSNIQEAIRKIKMRQLYSGAVTLWDNEGTENWWVSIYAAHFLIEAQKAGFEVDKGLLETLLVYVNNSLKNRKTIPYLYNRNQNKKIAPKEVLYGLYVLALSGRPNVSAMNYYRSNPAILSLDEKYLLAAAFALAGDKKSFSQFLPGQFIGEESVAETGGSFYSDIRDESLALEVLVDADPGNSQIPIMAKHVSQKLNERYWYSTQELAFSFLALGKIAREAAKSNINATISVAGKPVSNFTGKDIRLGNNLLKDGKIEISTHGTGRLYYFWQSEGISASGNYKEEDSYLKVRKKFFDRNGKVLSGTSFKQNELIIVELTLEKSFSTDVKNVVITDMLPAGFEIENPRTKEIPGMDWIKNASTPTELDVRDDRLNLFVDLNNFKQTYYYAVRAVSPGTYRMGPVSADAMYNGEYHSYNGGGWVRVTP